MIPIGARFDDYIESGPNIFVPNKYNEENYLYADCNSVSGREQALSILARARKWRIEASIIKESGSYNPYYTTVNNTAPYFQADGAPQTLSFSTTFEAQTPNEFAIPGYNEGGFVNFITTPSAQQDSCYLVAAGQQFQMHYNNNHDAPGYYSILLFGVSFSVLVEGQSPTGEFPGTRGNVGFQFQQFRDPENPAATYHEGAVNFMGRAYDTQGPVYNAGTQSAPNYGSMLLASTDYPCAATLFKTDGTAIITPVEYWSYGGRYDTATGLRTSS